MVTVCACVCVCVVCVCDSDYSLNRSPSSNCGQGTVLDGWGYINWSAGYLLSQLTDKDKEGSQILNDKPVPGLRRSERQDVGEEQRESRWSEQGTRRTA